MSSIVLTVTTSEGKTQRYELPTTDTIAIGTEGRHRVTIKDHEVANHHADIRFSNRRATIEDQQTHQGTFVNDVRVRRTRLHEGDRVRIGAATIDVAFTGSTYHIDVPDEIVAGTTLEGTASFESFAGESREHDMWLKLSWRCRNRRRIVDERVVARIDIEDAPGTNEWPFRLDIPFAPVSFRGSRIEVEWVVILETAPSQDSWFQVASRTVKVIPGRLPPAKPDALAGQVAYRTIALPRTRLADGHRSREAVVEHLDGRPPQVLMLREREIWAAGLVTRARSAALFAFAARVHIDRFDAPWVTFAGDRAYLSWTVTARRRIHAVRNIGWRVECVERFDGERIVYTASGTVDQPTELLAGEPAEVRCGITIPPGMPGSLRTSSVELFWRVQLTIRTGWLRRTRETNEFWVMPALPPER